MTDKKKSPCTAGTEAEAEPKVQDYFITWGRGKQEAKNTLDGIRKAIWDVYAALNLPIVEAPLKKAAAITTGNGNTGIDPAQVLSPLHECELLAHELGHQVFGALYSSRTPKARRMQMEATADMFAAVFMALALYKQYEKGETSR